MSKPTVWSRAKVLAERTPETRNRYVDFLRAASITVVVLGHWSVAAAYVADSHQLQLGDMLTLAPWTQWLTWVLQVMPIFFIVGGYANGISWEAARRDGKDYAVWIGTRLRRLVGPLVPLLLTWSTIGVIAHQLGVHPEMIRIGSQAALIPSYCFRGMADASWQLQTSLERHWQNVVIVEGPSLRAFSKYASSGTLSGGSEWERLAIAQHNGLPTRCLDWTSSPLIAAHFATAERDHYDKDGVIWCCGHCLPEGRHIAESDGRLAQHQPGLRLRRADARQILAAS